MITSMLSHDFMIRAFVAGLFISVCCALLGVVLVLKRFSMIGDGLSHVGYGSLAVAASLNLAPLQVALPVVVIAAFVLLKLSESNKINGDSAIAVISSSSLAIGVVAASVSKINTDLNSYLFGSINAVTKQETVLCAVAFALVVIVFVIFYRKIFAVTFDESFSKATGINVNTYNIIISLLTAFTIVIGMKIMGTLLISALIIFPAISSMRVCKKFKFVIIMSALFSIVCFVIGITFSFYYNTPTGATIVLVNLCVFIITFLFSYFKSKIKI